MLRTLPIPRIPPVARTEWTDEVRDVFAIMEGPAARDNGSKYNVMQVMANHPPLASSFLTYYKFLLAHSTLTVRVVEIVTLRVAWRQQSEYEWTQHVAIAKGIGLGEADIEAIRQGTGPATWSELERLAASAVDQLIDRQQIDDKTWDALASHLSRKEIMELLFIIGTYTMLCWAFSAMGVQLEQSGSTATATDREANLKR